MLILRVCVPGVLFVSQRHDSLELGPWRRPCLGRCARLKKAFGAHTGASHSVCSQKKNTKKKGFLFFCLFPSLVCAFATPPPPLQPRPGDGDLLLWSALEKCSLAGAVAGMGGSTGLGAGRSLDGRGLDAPVCANNNTILLLCSLFSPTIIISPQSVQQSPPLGATCFVLPARFSRLLSFLRLYMYLALLYIRWPSLART